MPIDLAEKKFNNIHPGSTPGLGTKKKLDNQSVI